jgi:hypothetical protein
MSEGMWEPMAGYRFATAGVPGSAVWVPGIEHPTLPHVYASSTIGDWYAADGYALQRNWYGQVVGVTSTRNRFWRVVLPALGAIVANSFAQPREGDGVVASQFVRPLAKELRDQAIVKTFEELTP